MHFTQSIAIAGATFTTLTAAVPHVHNHFHKHHARNAEADGAVNVVTTIYTTVTGGAQAENPPAPTLAPSANSNFAPVKAAVSADEYYPHSNANANQPSNYYQPASSSSTTTTSSSSAAAGSSHTGSTPPSTGGSTGGSSPDFQGSSSSPMITILNNCDQDIYLGINNNPTMTPIRKGSSNTTSMAGSAQAYKVGFDDGCAWDPDWASPGHGAAEVEFSIPGSADGSVAMNYDLSFIKGNPFKENGQSLRLQDTSCKQLECEPGTDWCKGVYNDESQNLEEGLSLPCMTTSSMVFTACTSGGKMATS